MPKLKLIIEYDTETYKVRLGGDEITLGLGAMLCHEALIQLEEKRRIAFIQQLQAEANEQAVRRAIAAGANTREV